MAKNELLPFADGEDANVLPTNQWEALTDILENGFQSGIARSEQVNRVLAQGAVASYVLGQLIVDQLNKDATLDKSALYQNLILALQENAKDACLPLSGGNVTGNLTVQGKNVVCSVNGTTADASGNVAISVPSNTVSEKYNGTTSVTNTNTVTFTGLTPYKPLYVECKNVTSKSGGTLWADLNSGIALVSPTKTTVLNRNETIYWVVIPIQTSVSLALGQKLAETIPTAHVVAYQ